MNPWYVTSPATVSVKGAPNARANTDSTFVRIQRVTALVATPPSSAPPRPPTRTPTNPPPRPAQAPPTTPAPPAPPEAGPPPPRPATSPSPSPQNHPEASPPRQVPHCEEEPETRFSRGGTTWGPHHFNPERPIGIPAC